MKLRFDGPGHRFDARALKPGDYHRCGEVEDYTAAQGRRLLSAGWPHFTYMSESNEDTQDEPEAASGEGQEQHEEE